MSRIYFHTPDRTAEVYGSERAYLGSIAHKFALGIIDPMNTDEDREWLRSVTVDAEESYVFKSDDWLRAWRTWFNVGWDDKGLLVRGEKIGCTDLALNTLIATRSPVLDLMARIHGTCEDHAWCAVENLPWLAAVIRVGREENVLRPEQGWEDVIGLCQGGHPVVLSYSVTDSFPNRYVIGEPWFYPWAKDQDSNPSDAEADERWYELPDGERWTLAFEAIKRRKYNRELRPGEQQGFMSGASAFDLMADRWSTRQAMT